MRRKMVIFLCAVVLDLFTSMSKVLIPGSLFEPLGHDLNCSAAMLTAIGSAYMYSYAASQLCLGLFADRFGGVRILLFGGTLFAIGSVSVPFLSSPYTMIVARVVTAFGAGTVFIAIAKMIADLFPRKFALVMGCVMFLGYFGPVVGGFPTVFLVEKFTWRPVLGAYGLVPVVCMALVWLLCRGTIKPVLPGGTLDRVRTILGNRDGLVLFICSGVVFGSFYAILTSIGQKALEDSMGLGRFAASLIVTSLGVLVAFCNLFTSAILRLVGSHRKALLVGMFTLTFLGNVLGAIAFGCGRGTVLLVIAFYLVTLPAGGFSLFGEVAKTIYPGNCTGLAVATLNLVAFIFIALYGNLAGVVLHCFEEASVNGVYPSATYMTMFLGFSALGLLAMILSLFLRLKQETDK